MKVIASSSLLLFALIMLGAAAPVAKPAKAPAITMSTHLAESFSVPVTKVGLRSTLTTDNLKPRDSRDIWQINPQMWIVPFALGLAGMAFVLIQLARRLWAASHEEKPVRRRLSRRARQRMLRDFVRKAQ